MRTHLYSFAAVLLLLAISSAMAVPVYGTFSGIVTYSGQSSGYYSYAYGTPVTGTYEYSPDLLVGGSTDYADPTAFYQINIGGQEFYSWSGDNLNLSVDANGLPVSGSGDAVWDLFLGNYGPGFVGLDATDYSILAEVTYSAPSAASAAVPDIAPTGCLTGIAMLSLAVFGRLTSQPRKNRSRAR